MTRFPGRHTESVLDRDKELPSTGQASLEWAGVHDCANED